MNVFPSKSIELSWCILNKKEVLKRYFTNKNQAGIYLFKVKNGNTRTMCETCYWRLSGVFILNFEQISHIVQLFLLLTMKK